MMKYKPPTEPITRQEACLILDRKRFDSAVRSGLIEPLGKMSADGVVPVESGPRTAPLVFEQRAVRSLAKSRADELAIRAKEYRAEAKDVAKRKPPLTRRQITQHLGKRQTGILIRTGAIKPCGALTDTQTAAHAYDPDEVAEVLRSLADGCMDESRALTASAKMRVPA